MPTPPLDTSRGAAKPRSQREQPIPHVRAQLGAALRRLREDRGLTLEQVGQRIGRTKQGVAHVETGLSGASLDLLGAAADACGGRLVVAIEGDPARAALEPLLDAVRGMSEADLALVVRFAVALASIDRYADRVELVAYAERDAAREREWREGRRG